MFLQQQKERRPNVGIGVIVIRDGKVLIGRRKGSHGEGHWGFPGGHLEWNESFESAAIREVAEETGLKAREAKFVSATNDIMLSDDRHYITVFMLVDDFEGAPRVMEPDKCLEWRWVEWDEMPSPRFLPIDNLLETGYCPEGLDMTPEQRAAIRATKEYIKHKFQAEGSGHDWWHIYRVWKNAKTIAKQEQVDRFVVELAALLHDIADWKDHNGDLEAGPREARRWLETQNIDPNIVDHIVDIVRNVSYKGAAVKDEMSTLEGRVVQDADRLDAMGAIGIARTFTWGGSRGRLIYDPNQPPNVHKSFEEYSKDEGHSVNHFHEKLLLLKDRMHTEAAKRIAEHRHAFLEEFLDRFKREWEGDDVDFNKHDKLVRDKIPEIIQKNGEEPVIRIADHEEYVNRLEEKLSEEVQEYVESKATEELADVLEVVHALAKIKGGSIEDVERARQAKAVERGTFENRIVLERTE